MKKIILVLAALTLGSQAMAAPPNPPPLDPTKSIVDAADLLTPDEEAVIEAQTRQIYDTTHHHIVVLTMKSLDGYPVTDYINNAYRFYKIGNRTRNDGVLLLISMSNPRRLQIEVGYGLEGALTDAESVAITDGMKPAMKGGFYAGAINEAVGKIGGEITEEVVTPQKLADTTVNQAAAPSTDSGDGWLTLLVCAIIGALIWLVFYVWILRPKRIRREQAAIAAARQVLEDEREERAAVAKRESEQLTRDREERERLAKARPAPRVMPQADYDRAMDTYRAATPPVSKKSTPSRQNDSDRATEQRRQTSNAAAIAAANEADRQARQRRQNDEDESRRRRERDREEDDRRSRDSWTSSSSSSSSSSNDYSSPPSYDSGGSSGGGGGGSDF